MWNGGFLKIAQEQGLEVYGVDLSENAAQHCREVLGMNVHVGTLKQAGYRDLFFDTVTLWDLLEHVPYPREELLEINRVMKKDGLVFIRVPNMNFYLALRRFFGLFGRESPYGFHPEHHLNFFTPETLSLFLEETGFKVLTIEVGDVRESLNLPWLRSAYVNYNVGNIMCAYACKEKDIGL